MEKFEQIPEENWEQEEKQNENLEMPAIALRGLTVFPHMVIHFDVSRAASIVALEQAVSGNQRIFLVTQKNTEAEEPDKEDLYAVGTIAIVKQINKLPGKIVRVLVEGENRAALTRVRRDEKECLQVFVEKLVSVPVEDPLEEKAILRQLEEEFQEYLTHFPKVGKGLLKSIPVAKRVGPIVDQIAANLPLSFENKQSLLETGEECKRAEILSRILQNEIEIAKVKDDFTAKVREQVQTHQKEYVLKEQMQLIRKELGEEDSNEEEKFLEKVDGLKATKEIKDRIRKEIKKWASISHNSSENALQRTFIETLLEMPWDKCSKDHLSLRDCEKQLNDDHYGLEEVKDRILEYLAVRILTKKGDAPILCLVGPPGTGKTSIAKSVAAALHKKYVRICLGGVRDEAEIRGHRKTYVGAMPGRIAVALKQAGVKNPLILLDEIDKVSNDYKGDTFSALLEVLDSEQNKHFQDHYLEMPMDLSEVFFLATANDLSHVPRPLLDRMEVITLSSYTEKEKFHIAKEHLLAKQYEKNGIKEAQLQIKDSALREIISGYTKEAGVRQLEREIGKLCQKRAREIVEEKTGKPTVTAQNLEHYLGKRKYRKDHILPAPEIGIVRGLAWTAVGGDTLQIEVNTMPGKGEVKLTGQMGDVMKESAQIGFSYVRSLSDRYHLTQSVFQKQDFHIHIPEGAVPKDGPSAGITMATALISAVTKKPVRADIAMTGEITLRGKVLPIGGLKEKLLAAKNAGITMVLVPVENKKDVQEISKEITKGLDIQFVETMDQVLSFAFA